MEICLICLVTLASSIIPNSKQQGVLQTVQSILPPIVEESVLSVPDLIRSYNYPAETHHVTTEDGYVLELHRITGSPKFPSAANKPPVVVMHGILSSSADFVSMGPKIGLGFALADAGYDVWLCNARGNTWSKKNIKNLPYNKFWNFSWEEIGIFDIPAIVNYILKLTGRQKVPYICHSQGASAFLALLSLKPEYEEKFSFFVGLAPVVFLGHVKTLVLRTLALSVVGSSVPAELLISIVDGKEILPHDGLAAKTLQTFCPTSTLARTLCANIIFSLGGFDLAQLNLTMFPTLIDYFPAGSALKQADHFGQEINSGRFRRYDYGPAGNLKKYGLPFPPDYNVSSIKTPCLLIYGANDLLADPQDVAMLYPLIKNKIGLWKVPYSEWTHFDFLWGIDAKTYVWDRLIKKMRGLMGKFN